MPFKAVKSVFQQTDAKPVILKPHPTFISIKKCITDVFP
jgi:hypothetical protein